MIETHLLKVLDEKGFPVHGGMGKWAPGRWRTVKGRLVQCHNGLHLTHVSDLVIWLGPAIWLAEVDETEDVISTRDSFVARKARITERVETWTERTARLYAADCAARALHHITSGDARPAEALDGARRLAEGEDVDTWGLARAAGKASTVLRDAGDEAGYAAARAACVTLIEGKGAVAARQAARLAAEAAAWDGHRTEERAWQVGRLLEVLEEGA